MLNLAGAMAAVLATWAILAAAFTGIGLLVRRTWAAPQIDGGQILISFWLGFAGVICFLQLWNFALPVNWIAEMLVLLIGFGGILLNWRRLTGAMLRPAPPLAKQAEATDVSMPHPDGMKNGRPSGVPLPAQRSEVGSASAQVAHPHGRLPSVAGRGTPLRYALVMSLIAIWLANRAIGPGNADDSGLYHYSTILWAKQYPVVPGVGNLAVTLALNNASFLYAAMLDHGFWAGRSEHLANGLLLLALWAQVIRGLFLIKQRRGFLHENIYYAALLPLAVMLALAKDVSSPKTDLPAGITALVIGGLLLRMVAMGPPRENQTGHLHALTMLGAAAVCLKITSIAFAGVAGLIALITWWRHRRSTDQTPRRAMATIFIIITLLIGPWIARNVIMSGYPLFPSRALPVAVEWRVPEPAVEFLTDAIRNHSKGGLALWIWEVAASNRMMSWYAPLIKPPFETREQVQGWNWLRPWFFALPLTSPIEIVLPMLIAIGAALFIVWRNVLSPLPIVIAPTLAGLAFWFISGPDPRYGWPAAWSLAATTVALAFAPSYNFSARARRLALALMIATFIPAVAYRVGVHLMLARQSPLYQVVFYGPGSDRGFHPRPNNPLTSIVNRWGTLIYVPPAEHPHCWNGPLPCSGWPELDPDLRQRRPGDLSAGFIIDRRPSRIIDR